MNATNLPKVKWMLRQVSLSRAKELLAEVMTIDNRAGHSQHRATGPEKHGPDPHDEPGSHQALLKSALLAKEGRSFSLQTKWGSWLRLPASSALPPPVGVRPARSSCAPSHAAAWPPDGAFQPPNT